MKNITKKGLSLLLIFCMVITMFPTTVYGAAGTATGGENYNAELKLTKFDTVQYNSMDTMKVDFMLQTLNSADIVSGQQMIVAFNLDKFDFLLETENATDWHITSPSNTSSGDYAYSFYDAPSGPPTDKITGGTTGFRIDKVGLISLTPEWGGSTPLTLSSEESLMSVLLGLKAGVSWDEITSDDIRFATVAEITAMSQDKVLGVVSNANSAGWHWRPANNSTALGTIPDANVKLTPVDFTFAKSAYTGTQATKPTVDTKKGGNVTLTANEAIAGETVEYATATTNTPPTIGWQDSVAFTNVPVGTNNYFFARVKATDAHAAGTVATSDAVTIFAAPTLSYTAPSSMTINTAIAPMNPSGNQGSGTATNYTFAGTLPAGLSLAADTGVISGTPTAASSATSVTVTYTDTEGQTANDTINFPAVGKLANTVSFTTPKSSFVKAVDTVSFSATATNGTPTLNYTGRGSTSYDTATAPTEIGDYTVTATVAANDTYNEGSATHNFSIVPKTVDSITATTSKDSYVVGQSIYKATINIDVDYNAGANDNITGESAGVTVSPETLSYSGTQTITVSFGGKSDTFTVNVVAKEVSSIAITTEPTTKTYTAFEEFDNTGMVVTATYNDGNTAAISNYSIVYVNGGNSFRTGETTVTIKLDTFTQTVTGLTVSKANQTPTVNDGSVVTGGTLDLSTLVTGIEESGTVNFTINSLGTATGATLSGNILAAGSVAGTVTINATITSTTNYEAYTDTLTVAIADKLLQNISYTDTTKTVTYGDANFTHPLTDTESPGRITYESDNESVATVDLDTGLVTIKGQGTTMITATAAETADYAEDTASYTLTVNHKSITGATINLGPALTFDGLNQTQTVTSVTLDGKIVTYTVSDNEQTEAGTYTLKVTGTGNYTGDATESFTIAPKTQANDTETTNVRYNDTAEKTIAVTVPGNAGATSITTAKSGDDIFDTVTVDGTNVKFTLKNGLAFANQVGTITATVDTNNYTNYDVVITVSLTDKTPQVISYATTTMTSTFGDGVFTNPLTSTVVNGAITYTSDNESVATVDLNSGQVTIVGAGTAKITAKAAETATHTEDTAEYTLAVNKAEQATLTITSTTATYGTDLTLATSGGSGTGGVTYTVTSGTGSATITGGKLIPTKAGNVTVTATKAGDDNYNPISSTATTLTINKATYTEDKTLENTTKIGKTDSIDLSAIYNLDGATFSYASKNPADDTVINGVPTVTDGVLNYEIVASATTGTAIGSIDVKVNSTNYNDFNVTVNLNITDKDVPTLSASNLTVTYTGTAFDIDDITGKKAVGTDGTTEVAGNWTIEGTPNLTNANMDIPVTLKFTSSDVNYADATKVVIVTINKATPTGTPDYTAITATGKTLADAALSIGNITPAGGTITWDLGDTTAVTANTAYAWTYTPADAANYEELSGSLIPYRVSTSGGSGGGSSKTDSERALDDIEDAEEGDTVKITLSGSKTKLDKEIFEELAGKDITLEIKVGDVVWEINGEDIPEDMDFKDLDLGVSKRSKNDVIPSTLYNSITGETSNIELEIEHDGEFGFALKLRIELDKDNAGLYANLYYFNEEIEALEFMQVALLDKDGEAIFDFNHASTYMIVLADKDMTPKEMNFTDVTEDNWFYEDVMYVYQNGIMTGVTDTTFVPSGNATRATIWTVLARLSGETLESGATWYESAQNWSIENEVSDGTNPNGSITREQLVTMLFRYNNDPTMTLQTMLEQFEDSDMVSGYAVSAMEWAVANGIINGKGEKLDPQGNATRAEIATIMHRFMMME